MIKVLAVIFSLFTTAIFAQEVWLFGTKDQVFTNKYRLQNSYNIKHFLIDGGKDYETKISQGLSNDPEIALQQVKKLFATNKKKWAQQAKASWQGAVNAQSIGINKVPAITFDKGKTVVYGELNLVSAYQIWQNHKLK